MLGTGRVITHKQKQDELEDREIRRAIDGQTGNKKRKRGPITAAFASEEDSDEDFDGVQGGYANVNEEMGDKQDKRDESMMEDGLSRSKPIVVIDSGFATATVDEPDVASEPPAVASALRRNPDGSIVAPKVVKRKAKGPKVR